MSDGEDQFLPPDPSALGVTEAVQPAESTAPGPLAAIVERMMQRPGVVMSGESVDALGRPAVLVGVRTKKDRSGIPDSVDGVPIVVQVVGDVTAY